VISVDQTQPGVERPIGLRERSQDTLGCSPVPGSVVQDNEVLRGRNQCSEHDKLLSHRRGKPQNPSVDNH